MLLYPRGSRLLPGCLLSTERWLKRDALAEGPVAWAVTDVEVRLSLRESFMFFLWIQLLCYPQQGENTHVDRAQTAHKSDCVWRWLLGQKTG